MTTFILDLEVFISHDPIDKYQKASNSIPSFSRLTGSFPWLEYEKGIISQYDCYHLIGEEYGLTSTEVAGIVDRHAYHHHFNHQLFLELQELLRGIDQEVHLVIMSNLTSPEHQRIKSEWPSKFWMLFDGIHISSTIGFRKPSLAFYKHMVKDIQLLQQDTFFIEVRRENTLVARSLGFHALTLANESDTIRTLKNILHDPVSRGQEFLNTNACKLSSIADNGVEVWDSYSQLLILEATQDRSLIVVNGPDCEGKWNFFNDGPIFTTKRYPVDMDTTSLAYLNMEHEDHIVQSVMDDMLNYCDENGIIMTVFDKTRPRVDPVIATNILTLFHSRGRAHQLDQTYAWVRDVLLHRAYVDGTLYYSTGEWFLYYIYRLISASNEHGMVLELTGLLSERIAERVGAPGDALCLAMRLIVCASVGVRNTRDLQALLSIQEKDGGWEASKMYQFPRLNRWLGNRGLSTALAVKAIVACREQANGSSSPKCPTS